MRPFTLKRPTGRGSFSWGRVPSLTGGVTYRLFRRDVKGALHVEMKRFDPEHHERHDIARELIVMRRRLRETVDALDLKFLGVAV
jgi:hypothetical protein